MNPLHCPFDLEMEGINLLAGSTGRSRPIAGLSFNDSRRRRLPPINAILINTIGNFLDALTLISVKLNDTGVINNSNNSAVYHPPVRVKSIISDTRVLPAVWPRAIFALWAIREIYGGGGEPNKGETGTSVDGDVLYLSVEKSRQQSGLGSSRNCHTQQSHRGFGVILIYSLRKPHMASLAKLLQFASKILFGIIYQD
ncbi:hypothetical protein WN51_06062 [Melipona quadrifasciata]|uniref:Uncharacterized protein n=1 Tax=Melipona quadrifasciata TaxID=166423 RepID=A0A0N0BBW9_9HYME|nr:hypothetical protein WN51_06062 [Melipona quadrifasciata]